MTPCGPVLQLEEAGRLLLGWGGDGRPTGASSRLAVPRVHPSTHGAHRQQLPLVLPPGLGVSSVTPSSSATLATPSLESPLRLPRDNSLSWSKHAMLQASGARLKVVVAREVVRLPVLLRLVRLRIHGLPVCGPLVCRACRFLGTTLGFGAGFLGWGAPAFTAASATGS